MVKIAYFSSFIAIVNYKQNIVLFLIFFYQVTLISL